MTADACLDTNVLLRFSMGDVPQQFHRAKALLERPDQRYVVADAGWVEIAYALQHHYGLDRPAVVDVIESLMSIDSIVTTGSAIPAACATYLSHPKLSFTDSYLAAHAEQIVGAPLYTFDEKLAHQHPSATLVPG